MRRLLALLLIAAIWGCAPKERKIVIISTNDTHSAIDMFPMLATLVDSLRTENSDVLLVHAGDWSTGNPYADLYPQRGYPNIALMNRLGYDMATLGNHEFDNGTDTLAARLAAAQFPIIVANMETNGSLPQPEAFRVIDIAGVKLGFLGLITVTPAGHPDGFASSFGRATFTEPVATARDLAFLADSADLFIGLTHIGFEVDSLLALAVPEMGLIIGGHSHTLLPDGGKMIGKTLVTQTGDKLRYAGVTTITVNRKGEITDITNQLVDLSALRPDQATEAVVQRFKSEGEYGTEIGTATDYFNKNAVMSLYADALREAAGADVAIANRGGVRIDYLNPGKITRGDAYMIEPFGNKAVIADMTPAQLEQMIISKFNEPTKEGAHIEIWPSGFGYEVVTDGEGKAVKVVFDFAGSPARLKVAMSDYVCGAYDFAQRGKCKPAGAAISTHISDYVTHHTPIAPQLEDRATVK